MKKIGVQKDMHVRDIKVLVKDLLLKDEVIMGDCLVENSGAVAARIGMGMVCGIGLTFNDYADHFKVVATNKRLLLVGISHTVDLVTGVRVIEYNEIQKLKMTKKMNVVTITLNDGKYFELTALDFSDNANILENAQKTFTYVANNVNKEDIIIKNSSFTMDLILVAGFSLLILATIVPRLLAGF